VGEDADDDEANAPRMMDKIKARWGRHEYRDIPMEIELDMGSFNSGDGI